MDASIRIGSLEGYRDFVFELGGNPRSILKQLGLDEDLWGTPDAMIPIELYREAMNIASAETQTPHFGLLLSQRQSFDKLGAVGYASKHASTLGDAIEYLNAFLKLHDRSTEARLLIDGEVTTWSYRVRHITQVSDIQQCELGAGLATRFIRANLDLRWSPEAVLLPHKAPPDGRLLNRVFRCPIYFDADVTALEFPTSDLERPLVQSDPKLHKILLEFLEQHGTEVSGDIVNRVRSAIHQGFETGNLSIEDIARVLGLQPTQLQRQLKQQGTTYKQILKTVRLESAQKYLSDTNLSLTEITVELSYAQSAIFTRAFKKGTGMTPSEWRKTHASPQ